MDTIETLKNKLARAERSEPTDAKYPTRIVIDTRKPEGNIYHIWGIANRVIDQLHLSDEEIAEFKKEQQAQRTYEEHKALLRKWFGFVFLGDKDDE